MWHESRRQEKKVKGLIIDYQKRAERRKDHYEKKKSDPLMLLRITGNTCKLHLNPSVSNNEYSVLVPWQGDSEVMISRFDVRAHLDIIPEHTNPANSQRDTELESKCDYERYRQLVYYKFKGITQEKALAEINIDEMYPISKPTHHNKKSSNKTAIGYQYDKSQTVETSDVTQYNRNSSPHSCDEEVLSEIGNDLNLEALDTKQIDYLNGIARPFGITAKPYTNYYRSDLAENKLHKEELNLEKQKARMNKGGSRRERRALKMELKSKQTESHYRHTSPLSYVCRESPTYQTYRPRRDRSFSSSSAESGKIEYITEFGAAREGGSRTGRRRKSYESHSSNRERYRGRHRRRGYSSSSSRSRSRSRSRERPSHSRYSYRRERQSSERSRSSSESDPVSRNSSVTSVRKVEKVPEQPKLTHFEQMQLKMQNKISKQLREDQKAERARMRVKAAVQEDRESDIRGQIRKWKQKEREKFGEEDDECYYY